MYSVKPMRLTAMMPAITYTVEPVSDTPIPPRTLPIINSNGVAEPRRTSAMRCDFSSMTEFNSGTAPIIIIKNIIINIIIGMPTASPSLLRLGFWISPVSVSTVTKPSPSTFTQSNNPLTADSSMPASASRTRRR